MIALTCSTAALPLQRQRSISALQLDAARSRLCNGSLEQQVGTNRSVRSLNCSASIGGSNCFLQGAEGQQQRNFFAGGEVRPSPRPPAAPATATPDRRRNGGGEIVPSPRPPAERYATGAWSSRQEKMAAFNCSIAALPLQRQRSIAALQLDAARSRRCNGSLEQQVGTNRRVRSLNCSASIGGSNCFLQEAEGQQQSARLQHCNWTRLALDYATGAWSSR